MTAQGTCVCRSRAHSYTCPHPGSPGRAGRAADLEARAGRWAWLRGEARARATGPEDQNFPRGVGGGWVDSSEVTGPGPATMPAASGLREAGSRLLPHRPQWPVRMGEGCGGKGEQVVAALALYPGPCIAPPPQGLRALGARPPAVLAQRDVPGTGAAWGTQLVLSVLSWPRCPSCCTQGPGACCPCGEQGAGEVEGCTLGYERGFSSSICSCSTCQQHPQRSGVRSGGPDKALNWPLVLSQGDRVSTAPHGILGRCPDASRRPCPWWGPGLGVLRGQASDGHGVWGRRGLSTPGPRELVWGPHSMGRRDRLGAQGNWRGTPACG